MEVIVDGAAAARSAGPGPLLIRGGSLFDGTGAPPRPADLIVDGDRIGEIGPRGGFDGRAISNVLDASGMTVLPGLIDAHVHVGREPVHDGALYLSAGVTSVRDTGGVLERLVALRERSRSGSWQGPRLRICGPLLDGTPTIWPAEMSAVVESTADARSAVDRLAQAGVDALKVYSGIGPALVREIVSRARAYGLPVIGDLSATSASEAIEAGIAGLEHASVVYADLVPRDQQVTMQVFHERGAAVWRRQFNLGLAAADPTGPAARIIAGRIAQSGVWFDPTLVVLDRQARLDDPEVTGAPEVSLASETSRAMWAERVAGRATWTPADFASARRAFEVALTFVGEVVAANGTILVGSDAPNPYVVPGWSLHRELELLVHAGLTPRKTLAMATSGNALALGMSHMVGTLTQGKLADIVVVAGDPTADISRTRDIRYVIQGGTLVERAR
ncbi:MAG: hypothetical protein EXR61_02840 [Chloroflexi bacterium]|nr:hypothetical protein [Chloroflexota bacterium]